jgi:DNA-directed RNA polymerase subunit omega
MARIDVNAVSNIIDTDKCVANVGSRFDMIIIGSRRARELAHGAKKLVNTKNSHVITALQEIEAGLVGREYLAKNKTKKD